MDGRPPDGVFQPEDFLALGAGVGAKALRERQRSVSPSDVCFILYTSGSTALPKGVTLAHGGIIENGFNIGERQGLTPDDRVLLSPPLFWSYGSANAMLARVPDPSSASASRMREYRITRRSTRGLNCYKKSMESAVPGMSSVSVHMHNPASNRNRESGRAIVHL